MRYFCNDNGMYMNIVPRVKGTQDFIDLRLFNFIINQFKQHVSLYHFTQIETPILEHTDLFKRSLGEHTDVVSKEMFLIASADDKETICLRPEATAPTVRAFIEANPITPWKIFSYGPMFRYERPQKGRYRQFHQINMEIIGSHSISQDVQLIAMLDRFFHERLRLDNYSLQVNFLGTPQDRVHYIKKLKEFFKEHAQQACATCQERIVKNPLRIFDCKNEDCQNIYRTAPHIVDTLSAESQAEWQKLKQELSLLSITFVYNPKLVRGLDYYSKTVFEFASGSLGAQNAFCGGGRYDQLVKELGAKVDHPSIGAAIGLERLMMLLEPIADSLGIPQDKPLYAVMPLAVDQQPLALLIADTLHAANLSVDTLLEGDSLKSMMRKANKMGASFALIVGEQEQRNKTVLVKNMMTGEQQEVAQIDLVSHFGG